MYSIIGSALNVTTTNLTELGTSANITNRVLSPTQIIITTIAGPMQVNITNLNSVEVRFYPSNTFSSAPTYAPPQAGGLGQAIDTLLIHFSLCDIA